MNLCTMFRASLYSVILIATLSAQNYQWPIRASHSLSATFCEYRSGHLHAGVDIKTWGEMEVPCLAIADGYVERIVVSYNGYGRGLFLRLNDGNMAVYGHLEQFNPMIERMVTSRQLENDKYNLRLEFEPDEFPVRAGELIGYSGTSGTEHPHLHFEIWDSLRFVLNPQLFYPKIRDTQAPVFDEILLIPSGANSRINGSLSPLTIDLSESANPVSATGPFKVAINAHDRANGTYNKYNIFSAQALVNDSLVFRRVFDQAPLQIMDEVDAIYPGMRGRRGWRFMSLFKNDQGDSSLFTPISSTGLIKPLGISNLEINVADINGNEKSTSLIFHEKTRANWEIEEDDGNYIITRRYPEDGYQRVQFYTGSNSHIPIAETFYRLHSTTWVISTTHGESGIRALVANSITPKWIIPPANQVFPDLDFQWSRRGDRFFLRFDSEDPFIYPLSYSLLGESESSIGEIHQSNTTQAETDLVSLQQRARSKEIVFYRGADAVGRVALKPLEMLAPGEMRTMSTQMAELTLEAQNRGSTPLFLQVDTLSSEFNKQTVFGLELSLLCTDSCDFSGRLQFQGNSLDSTLGFFSPGKKGSWKLEGGLDSRGEMSLHLTSGGSYFVLADALAPTINPLGPSSQVKRGQRLVFEVNDNTKIVPYPRGGFKALLDGTRFFPDYNPLRKELSFHVPKKLSSGQHTFELTLQDKSGNQTTYTHRFKVIG